MRRKIRRKKGPVRSNKVTFDGITFASGLEKYMHIALTPDFMGQGFIIECKGRANESFPLRWKMFKKYVQEHLPNVILYRPQNQKECDETVRLILKNNRTNK